MDKSFSFHQEVYFTAPGSDKDNGSEQMLRNAARDAMEEAGAARSVEKTKFAVTEDHMKNLPPAMRSSAALALKDLADNANTPSTNLFIAANQGAEIGKIDPFLATFNQQLKDNGLVNLELQERFGRGNGGPRMLQLSDTGTGRILDIIRLVAEAVPVKRASISGALTDELRAFANRDLPALARPSANARQEIQHAEVNTFHESDTRKGLSRGSFECSTLADISFLSCNTRNHDGGRSAWWKKRFVAY
jgi:hypothetical protein